MWRESNAPDVAYAVSGLSAGGTRALAAADAADEALGHLLGALIGGGDLGAVDAAPDAVAGFTAIRDGYARTAHVVAARHRDLDHRASSTAVQGVGLVAETARVAGSVVAGMR